MNSYQKINDIHGNFTGILDLNDNLGVSIDNIGDLDGNGVNDLAVGAFSDDDGGVDRGAVWILFLDQNDQVINQTKISDISGNFGGILDNDDRFGGAVGFLGDMNNDGLIELAVGADYDADGGYWHGAVWILSLNPDGTVNSYSKISDTQGNFTGFINGDAIFGTDIENIGDLDGDGVDDLAVGSRRDNDGGGMEGALWILFMNSDLTVKNFQKISETQGGFNTNLDPEDYFGGSVVSLGDLNGDGVIDLAVGSYRDDDQFVNSGSFYVLFMNTDGTVNQSQKVSNTSGGLSFTNSNEALFGESIDGVVDIDGDGKIEVVVGAMKQVNPTLSSQTGGFFIVELNSDGTVSEEYFYSYNENCFSGQLSNGDLFGGSVCLLNTNSNNLKIGVGAYRDSENGTNKGAVWILNLGELTYEIESFSNPNCDAMDGNITFSGLEANRAYQVSYNNGSLMTINQNSDPDGRLILTGLSSGTYSDIVVTDVNTKCLKNIGQIELSSFSLNANSAFSNPTTCNAPDGSITISGLSVNRSYSITYNDGSNQFVTLVSDANGTIVLSGLQAGSYSEIEISDPQTGCSENLGQIDLSGPPLTAQISFQNPTSCDAFDGAFMVSGLLENTTYELSYSDYVSHSETLISDANGIIYLNGLPSGIYSNIEVKQINSNCFVNLPDVKLECISREVNQCFKSKQYFTPNGDGQNDFWSLEILDINCDFKLNIFDRYGKLIKTLTPKNNKWDGTYRGAKMPADDYWFLVNYFYDSKPNEFKSHFALKR